MHFLIIPELCTPICNHQKANCPQLHPIIQRLLMGTRYAPSKEQDHQGSYLFFMFQKTFHRFNDYSKGDKKNLDNKFRSQLSQRYKHIPWLKFLLLRPDSLCFVIPGTRASSCQHEGTLANSRPSCCGDSAIVNFYFLCSACIESDPFVPYGFHIVTLHPVQERSRSGLSASVSSQE